MLWHCNVPRPYLHTFGFRKEFWSWDITKSLKIGSGKEVLLVLPALVMKWSLCELILSSCFQSVLPKSAASKWSVNLLEMQILGPYSRPTDWETLRVDPNNLCFSESSRVSDTAIMRKPTTVLSHCLTLKCHHSCIKKVPLAGGHLPPVLQAWDELCPITCFLSCS